MQSDAEVLALVESAFSGNRKPEHFTNYLHCEECREHDELLRARDRSTLELRDVGNICWQPISFATGEGVAYYFPALARLALRAPDYEYGWYGDTLHIHLSASTKENRFYEFCSNAQRKVVAVLLHHLNITRADLPERLTSAEEFEKARRLWAQEEEWSGAA